MVPIDGENVTLIHLRHKKRETPSLGGASVNAACLGFIIITNKSLLCFDDNILFKAAQLCFDSDLFSFAKKR
jgi:hypothetical protein